MARIGPSSDGKKKPRLQQFSQALPTRDSERGLVVNRGDVLFDTAKFDLRPVAREKLARLAGICLAYPGLRLEAEGHTDKDIYLFAFLSGLVAASMEDMQKATTRNSLFIWFTSCRMRGCVRPIGSRWGSWS